ncbi:DUF6286 domain-containing protein [Fodinicola acaciae]|uniref:DUF6286 domain-containing protein n=1 Tax=Fodinicola acaciae TaxID=2681555 RepID=UPI0013D0DC3B|nr:DUF6286 domain-containing protein [Fodinicola acaciae]
MRIVNRLLALVLGIGMVALGAVVTTEVVRANFGRPRWILPYDRLWAYLTSHAWTSPSVRLVFGVAAGIGLVLLVMQLWPRRRRYVPLAGAADGIDVVVPRRSLRMAIDAAAVGEAGVRAAAVRLGARRADVRVVADDADVVPKVTERITERIDAIGPEKPLKVTVRTVSDR